MDIIKVSDMIMEKIALLEKGRQRLDIAGKEKAIAISEYDKGLSKMILMLKEDHPATLVEKLAKGEIYQLRYNMEVAESEYKSVTTKLECIKCEMSALQSIFRHLEEK